MLVGSLAWNVKHGVHVQVCDLYLNQHLFGETSVRIKSWKKLFVKTQTKSKP